MARKNSNGYSAWLVTWEWSGEQQKREPKVVAVFDPRWSGEHVREYVEFLYAQYEYTLEERAKLVLTKSKNPYPAQFGDLGGVPWTGQIFCGHNPWLFARLVENLSTMRDETGGELATWQERPKPDITRPPGLERVGEFEQ